MLSRRSLLYSVLAVPGTGDWTDSYGDGTPDFLRLSSRSDQEAFRQWFTWLAECQTERLVAEVRDCSSLLRYCYREALRPHDAPWLRENRLDRVPPLPEIRKVRYPRTPLGASLFRVREGGGAAAFAQFADARTLLRFNCHPVSRSLEQVLPGDLLFYRQLDGPDAFHSMICLRERFVVYHTGPLAGTPGEMRRLSFEELLAHPSPRWRPLAGNANFLGVHRWNILRDVT